jgi:hypothetical protein
VLARASRGRRGGARRSGCASSYSGSLPATSVSGCCAWVSVCVLRALRADETCVARRGGDCELTAAARAEGRTCGAEEDDVSYWTVAGNSSVVQWLSTCDVQVRAYGSQDQR